MIITFERGKFDVKSKSYYFYNVISSLSMVYFSFLRKNDTILIRENVDAKDFLRFSWLDPLCTIVIFY